jgi:ABC-type polysaccharide/polyol phosphate export permease
VSTLSSISGSIRRRLPGHPRAAHAIGALEPAGAPVTVHRPPGRLSLRLEGLRSFYGHNYIRKYYTGSYLGLLWIPLRPTIQLLMSTLLFGGILSVSSGGRPYFLFVMVGTGAWEFFDMVAYWGYRSLQYNARYFRAIPSPWLPAVAGTVVIGLVQFGIYVVIGVVATIVYWITQGKLYITIGPQTLYVLLGLFLLLMYGYVIGLFLAPIVRVVRDVRIFARYPLRVLFVITPVVYTIQTMPVKFRPIAVYNPLTAPIQFMRHGLLGMGLPGWQSVLVSVLALVVLLPLALISFARAERAAHARQ